MLSPGKHYLKIPTSPVKNVEYRLHLIAECRKNPQLRLAIKKLCREDVVFYISTFGWQFNPLHVGLETGPFICWDFQIEAVHEILAAVEGGYSLVIEKSRTMGASWLCLFAMEWLWHFHPYKKFLLVSRDADAVDKSGDPDSLFWKLDFVHEHMPDWMMPVGWDARKHRIKMRLVNPETKSVITGEASTGQAGVGGRATAIFVDEFAQIKDDYEVLGRTASTSNCRIFNSTHKGVGKAFHDMLYGRLATTMRPKVLRMHWTQHPEFGAGQYRWNPDKQQVESLDPKYAFHPEYPFVTDGTPAGGLRPGIRSPWYDKKAPELGSTRQVAMDLDVDPKGSTSQFYDALTINHLINTYEREPVWEGELHYDRSSGEPTRLVPKREGSLRLWFSPPSDTKVARARYVIGADPASGTGATPSCVSIVNAETGHKVGAYVNALIKPEELGCLMIALARLFVSEENSPAKLAWETPGPGLVLGQSILDLGFRNVYYRVDEFDEEATQSTKPGWYANNKTKRILHDNYRAALAGRTFINPDRYSLEECLAYVYGPDGNPTHGNEKLSEDPSGARVNHGDRVTADALANMLMRQVSPVQAKKSDEPPYMSLAWRRQLRQNEKRQEELSEW